MNLLTATLILTACCCIATADGHLDGQELYRCGFEQNSDRDYDGWPDGWARQRGPGFPHYVRIQESQEPSAEGSQCLRIDLDGGAAAAFSPAIPIDPQHDYVLEAAIKLDGLRHDDGFFSIRFLDDKRAVLETVESAHYRRTDGWTRVRFGPLRCMSQQARYAVIGVHVQPGQLVDLSGKALFDDIWFAQIPRMTLETTDRRFVRAGGEPVTLECRVSGCRERSPRVQLEIDDALGRRLLQAEFPMEELIESSTLTTASDAAQDDKVALKGVWQLPLRTPGYYRVRATLASGGGLLHVRELPLAIVSDASRPEHGEFGWTLPDGEVALSLPMLVQLAAQSGIHWIKFPLWYDDRDQPRVEQLTWLADRLNSQGISLVGLLFDPPAATKRDLGLTHNEAAGNLFAQPPELWYPTLEPVMARMSLKVHRWQLGRDDDSSFAGLSDPVAVLTRVKQQLDRIGQDAHLGVGWNWIDEIPSARKPPWSFLSRTATPALTAEELAEYLSPGVSNAGQHTPTWVSLPPLSAAQYSVETRAADLIQRMISAKEHGAEKIFFAAALGDEGLVRKDGTPTELLLPWRITALTLAGAECVGRLDLPGGSDSRVFVRGKEAAVAVWNAAPTQEVVFLGEHIRQIDAWGRELKTEASRDGRLVKVGPLPTFITGVDEALARWQIAVELDKTNLPSVFGTPHVVTLTVKNHFAQAATGKVRVVPPPGWHAHPDRFELKLPAGGEARRALHLTFPSTASCGRKTMRFDFETTAERSYRFRVERPIELGMGDVFIKIYSHMNQSGELEVEQRLVNRTRGEVSFRCHLSAPNRRRMRTQAFRLAPGEDVQTYRLPDGDELVGETLSIRAEEIGGERRILNYVFVAEP